MFPGLPSHREAPQGFLPPFCSAFGLSSAESRCREDFCSRLDTEIKAGYSEGPAVPSVPFELPAGVDADSEQLTQHSPVV